MCFGSGFGGFAAIHHGCKYGFACLLLGFYIWGMKYLLPLFLISFGGFAAEPPVVKSKAAQELLKHPEFKKAMEAAPEFTKAVLAELDKHAPALVKEPSLTGVMRWVAAPNKSQKTIKLPQYNALDGLDKIRGQIAIFYDGWTLEKWKSVFGKPYDFELRKDAAGKEYFWMTSSLAHRFLHNPVTETVSGNVWYHVDKATFRIVRTCAYLRVLEKNWVTTPYGKKMGYK
jgi:hypothetical protein